MLSTLDIISSTATSRFFPSLYLDSPIIDVPLRRSIRLLQTEVLFQSSHPVSRKIFDELYPADGDFEQRESYLTYRIVHRGLQVLCVSRDMVVPLSPYEYSTLLRCFSPLYAESEAIIRQSEHAVLPLIRAYDEALSGLVGLAVPHTPSEYWTTESIEFYSNERFFSRHVDRYNELRSSGAKAPIVSTYNDSVLVISEKIILARFDCLSDQCYLLTYEQLLGLKDCSMARKNALLAINVLYPGDLCLQRLALRSFSWQEECLNKYGNPGYGVAKSTESLAKTYIPRLAADILAGPGDAFDNMIEKVNRNEEKVMRPQSNLAPQVPEMARKYEMSVLSDAEEIYQVVELFGLQKYCGHPLIDPVLSGITSAQKARQNDSVLLSDARALRNTFCHLFTVAFVSKHRRWPRMEFLITGTRLEQFYNAQKLSFNRDQYSLDEWDSVVFQKEFDLEYYDNYLDLMDDKSISLYADEKHLTWDQGVPRSSKRLVLELLQRDDFDMREVINHFENDTIPDSWYICSLFPKEREFKLSARMFTMMVLEARAFFSAHEGNLASTILPYFPQITMTDSASKVQQRFVDTTRLLQTLNLIRLFIELDLSSWNLMWRAFVVNPIGSDINSLFGLRNVFTAGHTFFERVCVIVRVLGLRPEKIDELFPPESDLCWYNHQGGFEGIIQKLWSICTVAMIDIAMQGLDVSYTITDQGDNIVLAVIARRDLLRDTKQQLQTLSEDIIRRCHDSCTKVNQELKPEECVVSTTVVTYSKKVFVDGVDYPTSVKLLSRVHPTSSVDFPSFSAYLQSIHACTYAAAESAKRPDRCYVVSVLQSSLYIHTAHRTTGPYNRLLNALPHLRTSRSVIAQIIMPPELGGAPIIGCYAYLYKGGGDPLSKSLASLRMLQSYLSVAREMIGLSLTDELYVSDPKLENLCQDPYGLPTRKSQRPDEAVADETLTVVRSIARNRTIREVLNLVSDDYMTKLMDTIRTLVPFNSVVARDLIDCSAYGSVKTIQKMFLKTRTIQVVSRSTGGSDLVGVLIDAGLIEIRQMANRIASASGHDQRINSLYQYVEELRSRWKPSGCVPTGLTSYLPIDFDLRVHRTPPLAGITCTLRTDDCDVFYERGPMKPYTGTVTVQKANDHGYKIVGHGYATSACRTLQSILSWAAHHPNVSRLVDHLSMTRAGIRLSQYKNLLTGVLGGDIGHRYAARIGQRDANLMGHYTLATFCTLNSDYAGFLSATTDDYPLMFQEFFLYLLALTGYRWDRMMSENFFTLQLYVGFSPLEKLQDNTLRCENRVLPPLPTTRISLVQERVLMIQRVSGPIFHSRVRYSDKDSSRQLFSALVNEIHIALGTISGSVTPLAYEDRPCRFSFGLQELCRMTIRYFLQAAAVTVLESVQGVLRSKVNRTRYSAGVNYIIQKFGGRIIGGIEGYLSHPDMRRDPLIMSLALGDSLIYDRRNNGRRVLVSLLASTCMKMFMDPKSIFYTMPVVVWSSTPGEATLSALLRLLRQRLSHGARTGTFSENIAEYIMGSVITRLSRASCTSECDKVNEVCRLLTTYNVQMKGIRTLPTAARVMIEKIAHSMESFQLHSSTLSSAEVVREFRRIPMIVNRIEVPVEEEMDVEISTIRVEALTTLHFNDQDPIDSYRFLMLGAASNTGSLGSNAFHAWGRASIIFTEAPTVIVGVGLGAVAVHAHRRGCRRIIGHDLRADFPPDVTLSAYRPVLTRYYKRDRGYEQSSLTITTDGDWFNPEVSQVLCSYLATDYLLVLDISSDSGNTRQVIRPLILHRYGGRVALRVTGTEYEITHLSSLLATIATIHGFWTIRAAWNRREVVYWFSLHSFDRMPQYSLIQFSKESSVSRYLERDSLDLIAAYILSPLGGCTGSTLEDSLQAAVILFDDSLSSMTATTHYADWTETLRARLAVDFLLETPAVDWVTRTSRGLALRRLELTNYPLLSIHCDAHLVKYLLGFVSRLLTHQKKKHKL